MTPPTSPRRVTFDIPYETGFPMASDINKKPGEKDEQSLQGHPSGENSKTLEKVGACSRFIMGN